MTNLSPHFTRFFIALVGAMFGIMIVSSAAVAHHLKAPSGEILLTVSGDIQHSNGDGVARFDREMLESLGIHSLTVETPWTDGRNKFSGPLINDLLKHVGAKGSTIMATAINDYQTDISVNDVEKYNIIFAMEMNGKRLSVRERGPLWVIFPWSDHEELRKEIYYSRSIWQLKSIAVDD